MKKTIGLVLPAYNEEATINQSFFNIKKGINLFPQHNFILFPIDDGSTDDTAKEFHHCGQKFGLDYQPFIFIQNRGVAQVQKEALSVLVFGWNNLDYILKTDLDADFDQSIVLEKMIPYIEKNAKIVAGVRWREITPQENAYEVQRRDDILKILKSELSIAELDPPSAGSQLYERNYLTNLFLQPVITSYKKRWGFEFLLDLVSSKLGTPAPVVKIENSQYDPARRPAEKVRAQYDIYLEIIGELVGKKPEELSKLYRK